MNSLKILSFLLILTLGLFSCPRVPSNDFYVFECQETPIDLGIIKLNEASMEYFPYSGYKRNRNLIFRNSKGEEAKFIPKKGRRRYHKVLREFMMTCGQDSLNMYKYKGERISEEYESEDLELKFLMSLNNRHDRNFKFVDYFRLQINGLFQKGMGSSLLIVTSKSYKKNLRKTQMHIYRNSTP